MVNLDISIMCQRLAERYQKLKYRIYFKLVAFLYPGKIKFGSIKIGRYFSLDIKRAGSFHISLSDIQMGNHCTIRIRGSGKLKVEKNVYFNNMCSINCLSKIEIGRDTLFGENVKLYDHNHRFRDKSLPIGMQGFSLGAIKIGKRCWFGSNVVILKGVTIGDNVVVGANCVVSEDIESNTIVKSSSKIYTRIMY